jgi:hypothetical protein
MSLLAPQNINNVVMVWKNQIDRFQGWSQRANQNLFRRLQVMFFR